MNANLDPSPEVVKWVAARVSPKRFLHIQGVARTAKRLAERNGVPASKALWAAWLHDSAKELDRAQLRRWILAGKLKLDLWEKRIPALWHPHAGVGLARKVWGIKDQGILEAIRCHTLGAPGMGRLAQVVFVADFIEPGRDFPGVDKARAAARRDLKEAVSLKCGMTIGHLLEGHRLVHPRLLETYNYFLGSGA